MMSYPVLTPRSSKATDRPFGCPVPVIAVCLIVFATLTACLALSTNIYNRLTADSSMPQATSAQPIWDESYMLPVVREIVNEHWSLESLVDYQDTKGPAFFWTYAAWCSLFSTSLSSLRLLTMALTVLCAWPASLIAWRAWRDTEYTYRQKAWITVFSVSLIWLLPYQPVLSQLFMSEPLFDLLSLWAIALALIGFEQQKRSDAGSRSGQWPYRTAYTIVLVLLVHVRVQAVVVAGAVCLTAAMSIGVRASAGWWIASVVAGASRIPLWIHWGGLVSPDFQSRYGLGFRLDALTYFLIALLPVTVAFLWLPDRLSPRRTLYVIGGAAVLGAVLGVTATPNLDLSLEAGRYMGLVASVLRESLPTSFPARMLAWIGLTAIGAAALGGAVLHAQSESAEVGGLREPVLFMAIWLVVIGWLLHALTRGDVFDRYLLPFTLLVPTLWLRALPAWLVAAMAMLLMLINAVFVSTWLIV